MTVSLIGRVLLLGGSGYLSRAIMLRAKQENWNAEFTVFSRGETNQFLCKRKFPKAAYILGDVRDEERLILAMAGHDTVIHTAAVKSVPGAELGVSECISVNVGGTQAVISAARKAGVKRVVAISTDKSCLPETTYGFTKALLERMIGETATWDSVETEYVSVRYGNVIGSTSSIVPLFRQQFEQTGTVEVTDPTMTRFWMPWQDAVDLITYAVVFGRPGHILIPSPLAMVLSDLVAAVVPDADVRVVGLRPGEKMHEKLITPDESRWLVDSGTEEYFCLPTPVLRSSEPNASDAFEYSSEFAFRMKPEDFLRYADESTYV